MIKPQNEKEKKELQDLYNKFDDNGDGEIDFEEFVNGFNKM
jgi:Ca2+-binding EF-hand superfamily protein